MVQLLLFTNWTIFVPRPPNYGMVWKKRERRRDTTHSIAHLCIPNEVDSNFAVFDVYLSSKRTPKPVVHVKQQVHHNCFVEKGPLVASANKRWECIYKAHTIWSSYTVHLNPLFENKTIKKRSPAPSRTCLLSSNDLYIMHVLHSLITLFVPRPPDYSIVW